MKLKFNIFFVGLFIIGFSGCYEKPSLPKEPKISYVGKKKFTVFDEELLAVKDSVVLTIFFQDGDGNLGLSAEDKQTDKFREYIYTNPNKTDSVFNPNSRNYRISAFIRDTDGQFIPYEVPEATLTDAGAFERLDEDDKKNPIEGTLSRKLEFVQNFYAPNTVLKFKIRIQDRDLYLSNEIETDTVIINYQN